MAASRRLRVRSAAWVGAGGLVLVLAIAGVWWENRENLVDEQRFGTVSEVPLPVVALPDTVRALQSTCYGPIGWVSTDVEPALLAVERFVGGVELCLESYRLPDEDPDKDYFRAVVSGAWATDSMALLFPWEAEDLGQPAGEVWVELAWDVPSTGDASQSMWRQYGFCDAAGSEPVLATLDSLTVASELPCEEWPTTIGQPVTEEARVAFGVAEPHHRTATAMLLDLAVPEGELPMFTLEARQVDLLD